MPLANEIKGIQVQSVQVHLIYWILNAVDAFYVLATFLGRDMGMHWIVKFTPV